MGRHRRRSVGADGHIRRFVAEDGPLLCIMDSSCSEWEYGIYLLWSSKK